MIAAFINYGALIAFSFVNISVFAWFAVRKGRRHGFKDIFNFIIMPAIGVGMTGILWANLHLDALIGGGIWTIIGLAYLVIITRGFKKKVASFDEAQPVTGYNKIPESDKTAE